MEPDLSTIEARLCWARERAGLERSEVAERTGISAKTIEGHENGRRLKRGLIPEYSGPYARVYGVSESWLALGEGEPVPSKPGTRRVSVRGRLQAGLWCDTFDLPLTDQFDVWVNDRPEFRKEVLYGAVVRGTSMNRVYPDGTIVILRRAIEWPADLMPGKRYHVERVAKDGTVENTLKTVRVQPDGRVWLVPESDDPAFQETIPVSKKNDGDVSFVGRVVLAIIPE